LPGLEPLIQRRRFRWFYDAADRVWSLIDTFADSRCEQAAAEEISEDICCYPVGTAVALGSILSLERARAAKDRDAI
jgi:hypothetical protein